jgi:hypothetical protein
MKYLSANRTAYNSYFKWKKHITYHKIQSGLSPICSMCIKLHLEDHFGIERKVIPDVAELWNKKTNCKRGKFTSEKNFLVQ